MTVIVGLETNKVKEKAVVLGADKLIVDGDPLITQFIRYVESYTPSSLDYCFKFLQEKGLDKVKFRFGRKIEISKKNNSALAHTGVKNNSHEEVRKLLLDPEEFLKQDSLLTDSLFPLGCPKEQREAILESYKKLFNLDSRLALKYIPEIRRIFDLNVVKIHDFNCDFFRIAYWDRNYNLEISEYLFAKILKDGLPKLFDIALTGAVTPRQYYAKGCGANYALEYMRKKLGTCESAFFYPVESKIEKQVNLEEAVDIVTGAINYANKKNDFCGGLDYIIFTKDRIKKHFNEEEKTYKIDLVSLIDRRIKNLRKEINQLGRIKSRYRQKTN